MKLSSVSNFFMVITVIVSARSFLRLVFSRGGSITFVENEG
jgi:hypothetical protein